MKIAGGALAITTALVLLAMPAPSQAQFGRDDGRFQGPPIDEPPPGRRFRGDEDFEPPRRRRREFDDGLRGDGFRGGRDFGGRGSICVTSRGSCDAGFRAPKNTPCRCIIPGFGEKRGNTL